MEQLEELRRQKKQKLLDLSMAVKKNLDLDQNMHQRMIPTMTAKMKKTNSHRLLPFQ